MYVSVTRQWPLNYIMKILTFCQGLFKHVKTKVIALCRLAISVKGGARWSTKYPVHLPWILDMSFKTVNYNLVKKTCIHILEI